jgi:micrococcal nuclease
MISRRITKYFLIFWIYAACIGSTGPYPTQAVVVAVYDGDTIKVRFESGVERKVRLIGIDALELSEENEEKWLSAQFSKRFIFTFLYRKKVRLSYDEELEDKYGRILAYVWTDQGLFNEFILRQGFAEVFWGFSYKYKPQFIRAQKQAKIQGKGLWQRTPYPLIHALEAKRHLGELIRMKFTCVGAKKKGEFGFLYSKTEKFQAIIPKEKLSLLPELEDFVGEEVEVMGLLEEYRGQSQIMIFSPQQLSISSGLTAYPTLIIKFTDLCKHINFRGSIISSQAS